MTNIKAFLKKETVLSVSVALAIISAFFVRPDAEYISYIDFRVLSILLSLMIVMEGCKQGGIFAFIGEKLLKRSATLRGLCLVLIMLCFFSSMLITNDVALLTFVPFAMLTLKEAGMEKHLIPLIVFQTLAANLGSMLTPIGNPQNLYIYNLTGMGASEFMGIMLPYCICSFVLLLLSVLLFPKEKIKVAESKEKALIPKRSDSLFYGILFLVCILCVARVIPYYITLAVALLAVLIYRASILKSVDYSLILTFIAFFIFIGNMGRIPQLRDMLSACINGRELMLGIVASQAVSNVPAALLLSGFTENYRELLIGVNLGGLGTLIASMASLISYKIFAHNYNKQKSRYLIYFTAANVIFLAVFVLLYFVIN